MDSRSDNGINSNVEVPGVKNYTVRKKSVFGKHTLRYLRDKEA